MASYEVQPLARLVEQFERLPGIGRKTAQRLAFYLLDQPKERAREFADARPMNRFTSVRSVSTCPTRTCATSARIPNGTAPWCAWWKT